MERDGVRQGALAIRPGGSAVAKRERAIVLDQAFERLPGEVQSVESGIALLERGHHAQRLRIVIEASAGGEAAIERALAGMAERGMAEVVGKRQRFRQILVEPERARERARDLRDLQRMGQTGAKMVAFVKDEDLGLVREPPEGGRIGGARKSRFNRHGGPPD